MRVQISFDNPYITYNLYNDYRRKLDNALAFTIEMKKRLHYKVIQKNSSICSVDRNLHEHYTQQAKEIITVFVKNRIFCILRDI